MKKLSHHITSSIITIIGWCIVVIGIGALVLPGPGFLLIFGGLAILATRHDWAKQRLDGVRTVAHKAAHQSVASPVKFILSLLAAVLLIALGVFWGLHPTAPAWWPFDDAYWLVGGWDIGATLVGSGIVTVIMLMYSYLFIRPKQLND